MDEKGKDQSQPSEAYPGETIGSLMAECEELEQYILRLDFMAMTSL